MVPGQLDEEVQQVEGLAGGQGLDALEAVVDQLIAEDSGKPRALQFIQLPLRTGTWKARFVARSGTTRIITVAVFSKISKLELPFIFFY